MLQITPDVFSGRPNPSAVVTDEAEVRATLKDLMCERAMLTDGVAADGGLGLRGFSIQVLNDELASDFGASSSLYLPVGHGPGDRSHELAERLIALLGKAQNVPGATADAATVDAGLQQFLRAELERSTGTTLGD